MQLLAASLPCAIVFLSCNVLLLQPPTYFLENEGMIVANTVFASLLTMVTLATLWQFLRRLRRWAEK